MDIPPAFSSQNDTDSSSSSYTAVGIATAVCGNLVISIALNVQRYAHIRLQRQSSQLSCAESQRTDQETLSQQQRFNPSSSNTDTQPLTKSPSRPALKTVHRTLSRTSIFSYYQPQSRTHSFTSLGTSGIFANVEASSHYHKHDPYCNCHNSLGLSHRNSQIVGPSSSKGLHRSLKSNPQSRNSSRAPSRQNSISNLLKVPLLAVPYESNPIAGNDTSSSIIAPAETNNPGLPFVKPAGSASTSSVPHSPKKSEAFPFDKVNHNEGSNGDQVFPSEVVSESNFKNHDRCHSTENLNCDSNRPESATLTNTPATSSKRSNTHVDLNLDMQRNTHRKSQSHVTLNIPELAPQLEFNDHHTNYNSTRTDDYTNVQDPSSQPNYLKSSLWWLGAALMTVGEIGNFVAYGFAPASIVSPLGVLALVSNCIIAPIFFNEKIAKQNYTGVAISVLGILFIITSVNPSQSQFPSSIVLLNTVLRIMKELNPHDFILSAVSQLPFKIYLIVVLSLIIILLFGTNLQKIWDFSSEALLFVTCRKSREKASDILSDTFSQDYYSRLPDLGDENNTYPTSPKSILSASSTSSLQSSQSSDLFSNLGLVALFGAFTALSTKCLSSIVNFSITAAIEDPLTYTLLLVLVSTAVFQVIFLNKALQRYNATVVIPVHFVFFTISVIIGSAITFHDFENSSPSQLFRFFTGCLLTFLGVWYITSTPESLQSDDQSSESDDTIHNDTDRPTCLHCHRPIDSSSDYNNRFQQGDVHTRFSPELDTILSPSLSHPEGNDRYPQLIEEEAQNNKSSSVPHFFDFSYTGQEDHFTDMERACHTHATEPAYDAVERQIHPLSAVEDVEADVASKDPEQPKLHNPPNICSWDSSEPESNKIINEASVIISKDGGLGISYGSTIAS